jgi:hypothetical protein
LIPQPHADNCRKRWLMMPQACCVRQHHALCIYRDERCIGFCATRLPTLREKCLNIVERMIRPNEDLELVIDAELLPPSLWNLLYPVDRFIPREIKGITLCNNSLVCK